ncbi:hypothetical protein QYE76_001669 [Lolium multiflorum]|uniref:Transposase (putative) gypsy type domain-containing protein n=1 Tax=Lolium multiflorum TaxID=4521 RepID=A0AAD8RLS9_LOLMU|nr:hypothetical protein QYE76_001669 [Lolium multiflorum]
MEVATTPSPPQSEPSQSVASLDHGAVLVPSSDALFAKELCGLLASLEAASPGYGKEIACVLAGKASEDMIKKVEKSLKKISDLGPHSVQEISLFVALCECYLGCPPYFPLWVSIFHGRATRVSKSDQLIPNGGITFQVKSGESFIDMALPKKAQSQWRRFWFYAMEYTPPGEVRIPQYTLEPSVPRRLNMRSLPRDQEEVVREMRLAIQALKDDGLIAANMYNCWLGRRLIPLRSRGHFMWEYQGQNDCTRSTATEWDEAEYRKALAKVTTATFTSFNDGLQPFSEDKPAPQVPTYLL